MEPADALAPAPRVATAPLFAGLHAELLMLLRGLSRADWERPITATGWTVRDVAAHMLDGDIRRLSAHRDGHAPPPPAGEIATEQGLVGYLDQLNATWVAAARRIGPPVLVDLLAVTGSQVAAFVAGLDPDGPALYPVSWAGEERSANWLDIGREFTERWHHQQQIREAVRAPGLVAPEWLRPVLEISVRALPHTYREVAAPDGAAVTVGVDGAAGGTWTVLRGAKAWQLCAGAAEAPVARVRLGEDTAWRLFFGVPMADARARLAIEGDGALGAVVLRAIAIMA
jgi:uncharacterized protein (TIGR03083 family)